MLNLVCLAENLAMIALKRNPSGNAIDCRSLSAMLSARAVSGSALPGSAARGTEIDEGAPFGRKGGKPQRGCANSRHGDPEPPINSRLAAALQHNRGDKSQAKRGNQRHEPLIGKLLGYTVRHLLSGREDTIGHPFRRLSLRCSRSINAPLPVCRAFPASA